MSSPSSTIVPLNSEQHAQLKVQSPKSFPNLAKDHLIPVSVHEFAKVGLDFPVIFVKDSSTGKYHSVALMGLEAGENLYCTDEPFPALYVPNVLRNIPFSLMAKSADSDELLICINESSPALSSSQGETLFEQNGEQSDFLKQKTESLLANLEQMQRTELIIQYLVDKELLVSRDLNIKLDGGKEYNLNGIYTVDEKKLAELSDEDFAELRKRGLLPALYAQLMSMQQIQRVIQKKAAQG